MESALLLSSFANKGDRHPPRMLMGVAISSFVGLDGFCVANEDLLDKEYILLAD